MTFVMEAEAVNPLVDGPSPKTLRSVSSGESGGANYLHSPFTRIRKIPKAIKMMPAAMKMSE